LSYVLQYINYRQSWICQSWSRKKNFLWEHNVKTVIKIRHLKICRNSLVCLFQHRRQWAQSHMSSKRH